MDNIRLISILPPAGQGVSQPQGVAQGAAGRPGIVVDLPAGSILSGFIVNRDAQGNPVLRTESGDITFASQFFLKIGSEVVIRIENRAGTATAHILTVDGQPPEVAEGQSNFARTSDVVGGSGRASPPSEAVVTRAPQSVTLSGTLITPAPAGPGNAQPLPAGAQLSFRLLSLAAPEGTASTSAALSTLLPKAQPKSSPALYAAYARIAGDTSAQAATATPATAQTPPAATPAETPTGIKQLTGEFFQILGNAATSLKALSAGEKLTPQTLTHAADAFRPPASPVAPAPVSTATVTATVIANDPAGEALLQTPFGTVRLQAGTALPPGSRLTLEMGAALPPAALPGETTGIPGLARQWESLQQIAHLLAGRPGAGSPSGFSLLANHGQSAPPPAQNVSTGLLLFISALRGGDFTNWLGDDHVRWLESQGHGQLVRRAEGEFAQMGRLFTETQPHQWQSLFFPVAVAGDWQQLRLYVKRDRRESGARPRARESEDTRFVIEADLSQMGALQLDGFVRRQEKGLEFDLFIRSLKGLGDKTQREILAIYNAIGELTGYTGTLLFQTVKEFPVTPLDEVMKGPDGGVVA